MQGGAGWAARLARPRKSGAGGGETGVWRGAEGLGTAAWETPPLAPVGAGAGEIAGAGLEPATLAL